MDSKIFFAGIAGVFCFAIGLSRVFASTSDENKEAAPGLARSLFLFAYGCFLKPHEGDGKGTQQDALESFYKTQAGIYDSTRGVLLKGREDMLALVAAQLEAKVDKSDAKTGRKAKRVWVDVGSPAVRARHIFLGLTLVVLGGWRHRLEHRGHGPVRRRA